MIHKQGVEAEDNLSRESDPEVGQVVEEKAQVGEEVNLADELRAIREELGQIRQNAKETEEAIERLRQEIHAEDQGEAGAADSVTSREEHPSLRDFRLRASRLEARRQELQKQLDQKSPLLEKEGEERELLTKMIQGFYGGSSVEFGEVSGEDSFELSFEVTQKEFSTEWLAATEDKDKKKEASWIHINLKVNPDKLGQSATYKQEQLQKLAAQVGEEYDRRVLEQIPEGQRANYFAIHPQYKFNMRGELTLENIVRSLGEANRNRVDFFHETLNSLMKWPPFVENLSKRMDNPSELKVTWESLSEAKAQLEAGRKDKARLESRLQEEKDPETRKSLEQELKQTIAHLSDVETSVALAVHEAGWQGYYMRFSTPGISLEENAMRKSCCVGVGLKSSSHEEELFGLDMSVAGNVDAHTFECLVRSDGKLVLFDHGPIQIIDPSDPEALKGWILNQNDKGQARSWLALVSRERLWQGNIIDWQQDIATKEGRYEDAIKYQRMAAEMLPEDPSRRSNLAESLRRFADYGKDQQGQELSQETKKALLEEALGHISQSAEMRKELDMNPWDYNERGYVLRAMSRLEPDPQKAEAQYAEAIASIDESLKRSAKRLSMFWEATNFFEQDGTPESFARAEEIYARAQEAFPENGDAIYKYVLFLDKKAERGFGDGRELLEKQKELLQEAINRVKPSEISMEDRAVLMKSGNEQLAQYAKKLGEVEEKLNPPSREIISRASYGPISVEAPLSFEAAPEALQPSEDPARIIAKGKSAFRALNRRTSKVKTKEVVPSDPRMRPVEPRDWRHFALEASLETPDSEQPEFEQPSKEELRNVEYELENARLELRKGGLELQTQTQLTEREVDEMLNYTRFMLSNDQVPPPAPVVAA